MNLLVSALSAGLVLASGPSLSHAQDIVRRPNESDLAFVQRVLHLNADSDPHVVATTWNGTPTVFVDYQLDKGGQTLRPLVALMRKADGHFSEVQVTVGEEEGGIAAFDAIGFADADHSGSKALITILSWDANAHSLVSGTEYEVRLFAVPHAGQTQLSPMKISSHFDQGCECTHQDRGPNDPPYKTHFRFKTIAAVKAELKRMGY